MGNLKAFLAIIISAACLTPTAGHAADHYAGYGDEPSKDSHIGGKEYSPYLNIGYPQKVFWGDTHLHTSFSTDGGMIGCTLGPNEAYRFSCGEMVVSSTGVRARLQRPMDFLVVADLVHAMNDGINLSTISVVIVYVNLT
jgi:hypothetical protein